MKQLKQPTSGREQRRVMLKAYSALSELGAGRGTEQEWRDVADALNLVEALVLLGKLDAALGRLVIDGERVMVQAMKNYRATKRMTVQPEGVKTLAEIVRTYDAALSRLAIQTVWAAGALVNERIASRRVGVVA